MNGRKLAYHGRRWKLQIAALDTKQEVGVYFHHDRKDGLYVTNWAELYIGLYFFLISFYVERER